MHISTVAKLPTESGLFYAQAFGEGCNEHLVLRTPDFDPTHVTLRIHSECLTGDVFKSLKCDCGYQLYDTLEYLTLSRSGMIIYLRQEGRGIGLVNKINAYTLQDQGFDTVQANHNLGFADDLRDYTIVNTILSYYHIQTVTLLTNNPKKINAIHTATVIARKPLPPQTTSYNEEYLLTKKAKSGHLL